MAGLSIAQLEQIWVMSGGPPQSAPTAAAIAMAESAGNPSAVNPNDPNGGSFGLWQINGVHAPNANPGSLIGPQGDQLPWYQVMTNPASNAVAAVGVSGRGTDFSPWSTYTSGAYQQFLSDANAAVQQGALQGVTTDPNTIAAVQATVGGNTIVTTSVWSWIKGHLNPLNPKNGILGEFGTKKGSRGGSLTNPGGYLNEIAWFGLGLSGVLIMLVGLALLFSAWSKAGGAIGKTTRAGTTVVGWLK